MAATLRIGGKSSDLNDFSVLEDGEVLIRGEGYLPSFDGLCSGDYYGLEVDLATGQILNWKAHTAQEAVSVVKESLGIEDVEDEY
jgi:hypothetical protein